MSEHARLDRNLRLYTAYAVLFRAHFWLPVFFLYFSGRFGIRGALLLEAIYYAAVVFLEVPSGYFSDRIGRRPTLIVSAAALCAAHALFVLGGGLATFAVAQVCLAAGIAFNSGTDVSFHHDTLVSLGRPEVFGEREARVERNGFLAAALTALLGGVAGSFGGGLLPGGDAGLRLAYALSLGAAVISLGVVLLLVEPPSIERKIVAGLGRQLRDCVGDLRNTSLRWIFLFYVLITILNHVPYEFYQPYLGLLTRDLAGSGGFAPAAAGAHAAAAMLVGSWFAARSIRFRDRVGIGPALLSTTLLQTAVIAAMGLFLHPIVVLLLVMRSVPRALMAAPLNAAIAPVVPTGRRATYLSMQSLAGRLAFAGTLAGLAGLGTGGEVAGHGDIAPRLVAAAGIGLVGLLLLAATMRRALGNREALPG